MEGNITTVYKGGDQLILGESDARCKVKNIICIYRYNTVKFVFSWRWNRRCFFFSSSLIKYLQPKSFLV